MLWIYNIWIPKFEHGATSRKYACCMYWIGYMAHLVQGFSCMRKLRSGATTEEDSDCGIHYVFDETYRNQEQQEAKIN